MSVNFEKKLNRLKGEAKEAYQTLLDSSNLFNEYMDEDDTEWKDSLINEMHRIRKALKSNIKGPGGKMVPRPNTEEYLRSINKRLKDASKDIESLFSSYCDSDEETL
jgi:hypothetical protein